MSLCRHLSLAINKTICHKTIITIYLIWYIIFKLTFIMVSRKFAYLAWHMFFLSDQNETAEVLNVKPREKKTNEEIKKA